MNQQSPFDLSNIKVLPLAERHNDLRLENILTDPDSPAPPCPASQLDLVRQCAGHLRRARLHNASAMLIFGAHLIKNGGAKLLIRLMENRWITHLATNGAGAIHDWEFAFQAASSENVRQNVASGTFGAWDETGRNISLALLTGALECLGFGASLGQMIAHQSVTLPSPESLEHSLRHEPAHPLAPARAELLQTMRLHQLSPGQHHIAHPFKETSVLAQCYRLGVPLTVHPGIGYDIIAVHPMFNGAAIGRAAEIDFRTFAASVERLQSGVVLSVGSAIMGPQVFEKSMSCVNNLRLQQGLPALANHQIYVVDIQDGAHWDWTKGEPPKDNPAYYLRFCKSFSRMGGSMHYVQADNVSFLHQLWHTLTSQGL